MKSPDEQVADNIAAEFKKQKLLADATVDKILPKISQGALSSIDWKLLFETNREKEMVEE